MFKSLNRQQQEAVLHDKGPLLILAGAGSGKTRALTHRLAYLVKEKRVSPFNILCLTFTNKAANEMKNRVMKLLQPTSYPPASPKTKQWRAGNLQANIPWLGTFHSVCAKILRKEIIHLNQGFNSSFTIFDEEDSIRLIKNILKEINIDPKKFAPEAIKVYISRAKNELITPKKYQNYIDSIFTQTVARVYPLYEKRLRETNALDFDNLINKTVELFKKEPQILAKYQRLFKYILVDEYQDTNRAQYILLKLLAEKSNNICVVGDDWQSIYRFRGADFRNILDFKKDYPKAMVIKLEKNYRSTGHILNAAQSVIKNNQLRSDKNLYSSLGQGEKVKLIQVINHEAEGEFIIAKIKEFEVGDKAKLNQSVVLYRTNAQSRALEEMMLNFGIPYRIIGGVRFYQRKEIKDVLAYLRLIDNHQDLVSLNRIINLPPRGISINSLRCLAKRDLQAIAQGRVPQSIKYRALNPKIQSKIKNFILLLKKLRSEAKEKNITRLIPYLLKISSYKDYLLDGTEEGEVRFENIKELLSVAEKYSSLKAKDSQRNFLEEVALLSDIDSLDDKTDALTLMTMHNAKGLEFDNVFIAGVEEDLVPHSRSQTDPDELEEERRLFYVAMTRAKKRLYLLITQERLLWGGLHCNAPSRFIREINPQNIEEEIIDETLETIKEEDSQLKDWELSLGDKIEHAYFGKGEVIGFDGDEIMVDFEKIGRKKLSPLYAPIKKSL